MLKYAQPWVTNVGITSIKGRYDPDKVIAEILTNPEFNRGLDTLNSCNAESTPYISKIVQELITPLAIEYSSVEFKIPPPEIAYTDTWGVILTDGRGMEGHHHSAAALTAVLYLTDAGGDIVFSDPRGAACRAYPGYIRKASFNNWRYTPMEGDVLLFPNYIYHYVEGGKQGFRVSLPTAYHLQGQEIE